jgi:hypothetical protein
MAGSWVVVLLVVEFGAEEIELIDIDEVVGVGPSGKVLNELLVEPVEVLKALLPLLLSTLLLQK